MATSTATPKIAAIIPVKGASTLRACLESLERQDIADPYEVVVVDGFHDDEVASVASAYGRVRLVRSGANLLQGPARNLGVEHTAAGYVAFIDADCVAEPTFLSRAATALDAGHRLVGGPILDARPWQPVCVADNFLQFADYPRRRRESAAEWFPGCNLAMRRDDFRALGGFPNTRMPGGEDPLMCAAAQRRWPGTARFIPGMSVRHIGRERFTVFLKHHAFFGYCRAALGDKVSPMQRRIGQWRIAMPGVVAWRLAYFARRTARWDPRRLVKMVALLPLILPGIFAWAVGFRRGCLSPMTDVETYEQDGVPDAGGAVQRS
jgi:glycosyltransferase involved in cell wall biosynthesis